MNKQVNYSYFLKYRTGVRIIRLSINIRGEIFMICIVLVGGIACFFGIGVIATVVMLQTRDQQIYWTVLISSFIIGSALVWYYNQTDVCN